MDEDDSHTFAASEFGFTDIDAGDALASIKITQLPANGTLTLNGSAVTANQTISAANISNLVFTPAADANGDDYSSFQFSVIDSGGLASAAQTMTLDVTAVNDAPTITAGALNASQEKVLDFNDSGNTGVSTSNLSWTSRGGGHYYNNNFSTYGSMTFDSPTHLKGFELNGDPWSDYTGSGDPSSVTVQIMSGSTEVWSSVIDLSNYDDWNEWLYISVEADDVTEIRIQNPDGHTAYMVPSIDNVTIYEDVYGFTVNEDGNHTFSASDFGFTDVDAGDALESIKITQLPGNGSLTLDGTAVTANQVIDVDDIPNLVFTPDTGEFGRAYASLQYTVSDGEAESAPQSIAFNVTHVNHAPTASDNTVSMNEDNSHTFAASEFGFTDVDAGDTPGLGQDYRIANGGQPDPEWHGGDCRSGDCRSGYLKPGLHPGGQCEWQWLCQPEVHRY